MTFSAWPSRSQPFSADYTDPQWKPIKSQPRGSSSEAAGKDAGKGGGKNGHGDGTAEMPRELREKGWHFQEVRVQQLLIAVDRNGPCAFDFARWLLPANVVVPTSAPGH